TLLTVNSTVVGTPSYMAPEQAMALQTVTTAIDVYALAAILYELLSGKVPFQAATPLETMRQVTSNEPLPPRRLNPTIDSDLETIALMCLKKKPECRYASAVVLAEDLERWLAGEPIRARPTGHFERTVKWAKRRPASAALLGILALSFFVGIGTLIWNW